MTTDLLNITWEDGKYGLIQDHTGKVVATRYGEPCPGRDLVGDKYTLSLAQALETSRDMIVARNAIVHHLAGQQEALLARVAELEAQLAAAPTWNFT